MEEKQTTNWWKVGFFGLLFLFLAAVVVFNVLAWKMFWKSKEEVAVEAVPTPVVTEEAGRGRGVPGVSPVPTAEVTAKPTPTSTPSEFADWVGYTSQKYHFRFKYDPDWFFNNQMPGSEEDERIVLQGDISNKGWPNIGINKMAIVASNLDELEAAVSGLAAGGTMRRETFGNGIEAVVIETPRSPQAYGMRSYYFLHDGSVWSISLTDADQPESKEVYDYFLSQFETF